MFGGRAQDVVVVANSGGWERRLFSLSGANHLCPVGAAHNSPGEVHQSSNSVGVQDKRQLQDDWDTSFLQPPHTSRTRLFCSFSFLVESRHRSRAILAVGPAGILPATGPTRCGEPAGRLSTRRDARLPHRQDACATMTPNRVCAIWSTRSFQWQVGAIDLNRPHRCSGRHPCQAEAGRRWVACKSRPKVDRPSYFQTPVTLAKAQKNENEVAGRMAIIAERADIRRRIRPAAAGPTR